MFAKLAMLGLMLVCVAYGGGLKHYETCLLAIPYGPGIMITVRLDNPSKYSSGVDMERYAGDGTLLATTEATVNGKSFNDVKLDNSAPKEDWGWIRVLATGKKPISVSYKVEWIHGDVLRSIDMQSGTHRHPLSDGAVQSAVVAGIHHKWTLDRAQLPGIKAYFFVNLSAYPVRLGMCQSDLSGLRDHGSPVYGRPQYTNLVSARSAAVRGYRIESRLLSRHGAAFCTGQYKEVQRGQFDHFWKATIAGPRGCFYSSPGSAATRRSCRS